MPNSIKIAEGGSIANTLKVGNMYFGVGDHDLGPTSSSGFYNGINPPSGGYTIYLNKSGGPSITCPSNDADLIAQTQTISGESMADVNACFAYFADQSDKMVMHNPISEMHLADLQLYLIAGVIPSYPRSGTSWKDLSGNTRNGFFTNGPTFNSNGWIEFDGVDDDIRAYGAGISDYSQAFSMSVLFKIASGATWDNGFKSNIVGVNGGYAGMYGIYKDDDDEFGVQLRDSNSTITTTCSGNVVDKWYNLTATWDGSTTLKLYRNGELVSTNNTGGITGSPDNTNFRLGGSRGYGGSAGNVFEGDIASYAYYTKLLSDSEILQNYHQGSIVTNNLKFAADAGNLVSYENGETTTYSLTGSFDGTLTNGVDFVNSNGGFWDFDGVDDYIEIPYNSYWDTNIFGEAENFTIMCWTKCDNFYNWSSMIHKDNGGYYSESEGAALWANAGGFQAVFGNGVSGNPSGWGFVISYATSNTTDWFHLAFTGDGTTGRFYVNGVEHTTAALSGRSAAVNTTTNPVRFGVRGGSSNYNGKITLPLLYDRGLSAAEVAQNYNATVNRFN